jgi:hypothetical protein
MWSLWCEWVLECRLSIGSIGLFPEKITIEHSGQGYTTEASTDLPKKLTTCSSTERI